MDNSNKTLAKVKIILEQCPEGTLPFQLPCELMRELASSYIHLVEDNKNMREILVQMRDCDVPFENDNTKFFECRTNADKALSFISTNYLDD